MDGIENGIQQNNIVGNGYDHYFIFNHEREECMRNRVDEI